LESPYTIVIDDLERALAQSAIGGHLANLIQETDLGWIFFGETRVSSQKQGLLLEPDLTVCLQSTVQESRVELRRIPDRKTKPYLELEGCPDLLIEVLTEDSVRPFPHLCAKVGIPEIWRVDLQDGGLHFRIHSLQDSNYAVIEPDPEGWVRSSELGLDFRLLRRRADPAPWRYTLEHRSA
jgi:Uma2 family endonuclease